MMEIIKKAIVTSDDIIKNYKTQRKLAEKCGRIYVFKHNQPDAVLFSIKAFEMVSMVIEAIENSDKERAIRSLEEIIKKLENGPSVVNCTLSQGHE